MIIAENLSKQFDDFLAVEGVSLQVKAGEVMALLGPNGAGKTTTVRMLTSILRPTSGWARVAGYDVVDQPAQVRASVGTLTEQHGFYERMSAEDYLGFFGQLYGMNAKVRRERTQELLENFQLTEVRKRKIGDFSKGMRQKLALSRALLHDPPVLLLDEPTSGMDPESAHLVRESIRSLRSENRAILICTHNLTEAEELVDHIAIIRKGKIIAQGSPASLKKELLGPSEYEVRLNDTVSEFQFSLPPEATFTAQGISWFRYRTYCPEQVNPVVLQGLLTKGYPVLSLQEIPRNLEQVYLQAVTTAKSKGE